MTLVREENTPDINFSSPLPMTVSQLKKRTGHLDTHRSILHTERLFKTIEIRNKESQSEDD